MNIKENPPLGCHLGRGRKAQTESVRLNPRTELIKDGYDLQVSICSRGFSLFGFQSKNKGKPENLKKREDGDIKGWSSGSRRRLQRFAHDYKEPDGWALLGATNTVPGPVLTPRESKELWATFTKHLDRKKVIIIWRAEVQKRGAVHWHMLVALHPSLSSPASIYRLLCERWFEAVEALGAVSDYTMGNGTVITSAPSRMALPGARERAVDIEEQKGGDAWLRYICDHLSKSKQEQVGEDIGRHWGVIGRKYAVRSVSLVSCELTYRENFVLRRFLRRLCTPRVKNERSPFGFSLGWAPKSSLYGRQDRFGHTLAVRRLLSWVKSIDCGGEL